MAAAVARASRSNTGQFDNAPKAPSASSQVDDFDEFDPRASSGTVIKMFPFLCGSVVVM